MLLQTAVALAVYNPGKMLKLKQQIRDNGYLWTGRQECERGLHCDLKFFFKFRAVDGCSLYDTLSATINTYICLFCKIF